MTHNPPSTSDARAEEQPQRFYVKPDKPVCEMTDAERQQLADELFELTAARIRPKENSVRERR